MHPARIFALGVLCVGLWLPWAVAAAPGVKHVIIIGCDGMRPDGVMTAKAPNMKQLMKSGSYTLHARGVMPTSSSPNWASMIMGAGPEQHGVTSNEWQPNKFEIAPTAVGSSGIFPTIFGTLRQQRPSAVMAVFHDWGDFARLVELSALNTIEHPKGPVETTRRAIDYLKENKPDFLFIHLDSVDHAGHEHGHGTPQYYQAVEEADGLIGEVVQALKETLILDQTIILITADHGGIGKRHGEPTMAEIEIPWILSGAGVNAGKEIRSPVNTYDTAATVAYIFGLTPPAPWIGKPVLEAFR